MLGLADEADVAPGLVGVEEGDEHVCVVVGVGGVLGGGGESFAGSGGVVDGDGLSCEDAVGAGVGVAEGVRC